MLRGRLIQIRVRNQLEEQVDNVYQQQDLLKVSILAGAGVIEILTTLVPRLIFRDCLSASLRSLKDAWNAVYKRVRIVPQKCTRDQHTGKTKLITLKLRRQALTCVTVLL